VQNFGIVRTYFLAPSGSYGFGNSKRCILEFERACVSGVFTAPA
jgi:hypothetical protein